MRVPGQRHVIRTHGNLSRFCESTPAPESREASIPAFLSGALQRLFRSSSLSTPPLHRPGPSATFISHPNRPFFFFFRTRGPPGRSRDARLGGAATNLPGVFSAKAEFRIQRGSLPDTDMFGGGACLHMCACAHVSVGHEKRRNGTPLGRGGVLGP